MNTCLCSAWLHTAEHERRGQVIARMTRRASSHIVVPIQFAPGSLTWLCDRCLAVDVISTASNKNDVERRVPASAAVVDVLVAIGL